MELVSTYQGSVSGLEISVTTDLAAEPVTLAEAKAFMNVDYTDHDSLITSLIKVSRMMLEGYAGLAFGAKTVVQYQREYRYITPIEIGLVNTISEVLVEGVATTDYTELGVDFKQLKFSSIGGTLKITYTTKAIGSIPFAEAIKSAVKAQVSYLYEHRGEELQTGEISMIAKVILDPHRRINVF